jgi:regulation of enolase protein 1 (concanavalin A-like superfamily)
LRHQWKASQVTALSQPQTTSGLGGINKTHPTLQQEAGGMEVTAMQSPGQRQDRQALGGEKTPFRPTPFKKAQGVFWIFIALCLIVAGLQIWSSLGSALQPPAPRATHPTPTPTSPITGTQVPLQSCGGAFSGAFHGSLDSRWEWEDPSGKARHSMATNGPLRLTAPPHSDISPFDNNYNAPRLLQPITGGFTLDTHIEFRPNKNFQSAGLLVGQLDETTFLRIERGFGDYGRDSGVFFQRVDHGRLSDVSTLKQHPTTAGSVELRVQRQGNRFTASWREQPDQKWQFAGETDLHFDSLDNLMVGLDLIADYGAPPTTASYDYFRVSCT